MYQSFKDNVVVRQLLNTSFGRFLRSTHGNWQYPFIALGWFIGRCCIPRRRVTCDGVSFTLSCINPITHFRWYLFCRKEQEVRQYINDYIKDGDVFFDIGANVGVFSVYCASRFPHVNVFSFEPEYSNLNLLKENVIANKLTQRIRIVSMAMSDFLGMSFLNLQDTTAGAAAHTESRSALKKTDEGYDVVWQEGVACVTIDIAVDYLGVVPNAIKIDTDGNEDKILSGARKTLVNPGLRSLILEMPDTSPKKDICESILTQAGFTLTWSKQETKNQIWVKIPTGNAL